MVPPGSDGNVRTNLILHDGVSNILGKLTHSTRVCFISYVSVRTRLLQNTVQLVLDPFKSSVMILMSGRS